MIFGFVRPNVNAGHASACRADKILMCKPGRQNAQTSIDALRTPPTMRMKLGHLVNTGAASGVPDHVSTAASRYPPDNLRLGHPGIRIVDGEGLTEHCVEIPAKNPPGPADASYGSPERRRYGLIPI